jgi:hypothetical protein
VRSLNFPHGLARVSSRTIGASASSATSRWIGDASKPAFGGTGLFELGLSPLAFCDDRAQGKHAEPHECRDFGNAYTAATKLLNFASALTRPFRIVWTVTILQQGFPYLYEGRSARDDPQTQQISRQPGIMRGRRLPKG